MATHTTKMLIIGSGPAGYSAAICGPGDIAQAHQADEWLAVSEFEAGHRFMTRLLAELAA